MTGTQRMSELMLRTAMTLTTGLSPVPKMTFRWGLRVEPFSVGMRGSWAILADQVHDVHFHLAFDGRQLFVAPASPSTPLTLNGQTVDPSRWWPVMLPAEIRAAGAVFQVDCEDGAAAAAKPDKPEPSVNASDTISDGGALREHARLVAERAPPDSGAMRAIKPAAVAWGASRTTEDAPILPMRGQVVPVTPPPGVSETAHSGSRAAAAVPAARGSATPPPTVNTKPPASAGSYFKEASPAKKAILILLPVAFAATLYSFQEPTEDELASAPPPRASASANAARPASSEAQVTPRLAATPAAPPSASPSAATSATAVPSASASAEQQPTSSVPSAAPSAAPAASASAAVVDRAPKQALDAAFEGNLSDARDRYVQLAAEHPEIPAYRLAAAAAAEDSVRKP